MSLDVPEKDIKKLWPQLIRRKAFVDAMMQDTKDNFKKIKNEMLMEFNNHTVTQEIEAGPLAENLSGTLTKGNLFSFIGFAEGSNPTSVIREILNEMFQISNIRPTAESRRIWFNLPDKKEILVAIWEKTPLDWAPGRSWADGIENTLSGLARYVYSPEGFNSEDASRSGTGLQTKKRQKKIQKTGNFSKGTVYERTNYMRYILSKAGKKLWRLRMAQYAGRGHIV